MKWKKQLGTILLTGMGMVLFGCGKGEDVLSSVQMEESIQTEMSHSEEDTEEVRTNSSPAETVDSEEKIVWYIERNSVNPQVSEDSIQSDVTLHCKIYDEFNKKLKEKGFEKTVEFRTIVKELGVSEDSSTYIYKSLKEKEQKKWKVDIFTYTGIPKELAYDFSRELKETEAGKLLYEQIPENVWNQLSEDNKQFYIYNNNTQAIARCAGYEWNKELVEKYGMTEEDLKKDPEQLMPFFEKEKQNGSDSIYPIGIWFDNLYTFGKYDYFPGEQMELLFVMPTDSQNPSVQNIYENEDYIANFHLLHMLYEKEYSGDPMKEDTFVKNILYGMPEMEEILEEQNDTIRVARSEPYFSSNLSYKTQCIASWSEQKEDALELLAMVMSDPELSNLLEYGIEGVNYEVNDGVVTALDSVGEEMLNRAGSIDSLGNTAITFSKESEPKNKKDCYEAYVETIAFNPTVGFIPDYSNVKAEYEACKTVVLDQYSLNGSLFNGTIENVEEQLSKINTQLKEAGIEKVIAELNGQLQSYIQTKNK